VLCKTFSWIFFCSLCRSFQFNALTAAAAAAVLNTNRSSVSVNNEIKKTKEVMKELEIQIHCNSVI
jgi:hypothetical protein